MTSFFRISIKEQILFAKRLGILIYSGLPIMQALQMICNQANSRSTKYVFTQISEDVESGQLLSTSISKFKNIFGEFAINIIRVGELSGSLQHNLHYLAEELKKKQELRRKIIGALVYPLFIGVATLGIAILLTAYVFPKILPIFSSFKSRLPWSTRVLIFFSNGLIHYWLYVILGGIIFIAAVIFILKIRRARLFVDRHILYLPILGKLVQSYQVANFSRTFGLLLKSDVKIVEAIKIVSSTTGNKAYKAELTAMSKTVLKGEKLSSHMKDFPKLFPAIVTQMVAVGENTGNLSSSLMYVAEIYEDELNNLTKNLSTAVEPLLMIFMGLLVGFIAISIITPIYSITQNLHP